MSLSLHPRPDRLRAADNLIPTAEGGLATRPAARQIITGDIAHAAPWGNRVLVDKGGRIRLWDGNQEIDLAPAGRGLQATTFQALTANAAREDRLVVADGINPLWYLARSGGSYVRRDILNKVTDADGGAIPLPIAQAVATWRGRVWATFGTNRAQHCQFDDMEYWDPLFTVECQGAESDRILALAPDGERLLAGLVQSSWAVTGDSQFNWRRNQVSPAGVAGPNAVALDESGVYWVSSKGLHAGGAPEPLSDDIRDIFPQYPAAAAVDRRRRLLLVLAGGRLFVMHLAHPGRFGEITGHAPRGLIQMADYVGWYGADGAWVLGSRDMPDRRLDGTATDYTSAYETWEEIPNPRGRALLRRAHATVLGSARGEVTYTAYAESAEGSDSYSAQATLADTTPQKWTDQIAGLAGEPWPTAPVAREFAPYLAGHKFQHRLEAPCHMEVRAFAPDYKFGEEDE